jgi:hypothetical protein
MNRQEETHEDGGEIFLHRRFGVYHMSQYPLVFDERERRAPDSL